MEVNSLPLPFRGSQTDFGYQQIRLDEDIAKEDEWRWAVVRAFFDHRGLVADHINSFNNFVEKGIHEMFVEAEPIEVEAKELQSGNKAVVIFGGVDISGKPQVEAKDRDIAPLDAPEEPVDDSQHADSYAAKCKGVDINWVVNDDAGPSTNRAAKCKGVDVEWLVNIDAGPSTNVAAKCKGVDRNCVEVDEPGPSLNGAGDDAGPSSKANDGAAFENRNGKGDCITIGCEEDDEEPPNIPREDSYMEEVFKKNGPSKSGKREDEHADDVTLGKSGKVAASQSQFSKSRTAESNLSLLPVEARVRGMTYSSPIYVKVTMKTTTQVNDLPPAKKPKSSLPSRKRTSTETSECRVLLGRIPVMVKSSLCHLSDPQSSQKPLKGECSLDSGGYFIIKGSEKVIVAQEERNLQRLWVYCIKGVWTASCTSRRKGFAQYNYQKTTVRLAVPKKTGSAHGGALPVMTVSQTGVEALPIGVLFCALGVSSDREMMEMICGDLNDKELLETVCPSLAESDRVLTAALKNFDDNSFARDIRKRDKDVALSYIASKTTGKNPSDDPLSVAENVLQVRFLPHLSSGYRKKALYLGYMIRAVSLCYLGRQQATDPDDMKNKRLEFAGETISHQFRKLMAQVINTMKRKMLKHLVAGKLKSADKYIDHNVITKGLKMAFTSGNWRSHDKIKNSGIVFDLKRGNPLSSLCQLREIRQFVSPSTRVGDEARHPTFSQWGKICPIDTPDDEASGLVKNMAITGMVTSATPEESVLKLLAESTMKRLELVKDLSSLYKGINIFLNGKWLGTVADTQEAARLANNIRKARRRGPAKTDLTQVEVAQDDNRRELHISTDAGRILRPLLIVKDQTLILNEDHIVAIQHTVHKSKRFQWLLSGGVVELLGVEEEEKALIALHGEHILNARERQHAEKVVQFTHAELHPSLILGLSASLIPFPNRNQSSRNLYQSHKHCKQAMGVYVTNINSRVDTSGHHLFYPQVQLVKTNTYDCLRKPELFSGQNAIVAIACYTGYNQEDSIIMGQSSLDRGMFRTTHYRSVKTEEMTDVEAFGKPSEFEVGSEKLARSLEKLDEDGLPVVGVALGVGDVLVGKVSKSQSNVDVNSGVTPDRCQRLKAHEKGRVAQVVLLQDDVGTKIARVKLRESRMPQVGDKFSSMHGQKGVIGMVYTQEDLPFNNEGIVPDIIINPHAFPTRQTLGQMFESAVGKAVAMTGEKLFATPFSPSLTVESILDSLQRAGYGRWGEETMCNGFTGQPMEAKIFMGSTFYQRLDHMVEDKIKYRSRGHVHPLTRQPVADRKRHGGVKFGEMERDCLIAHGAAATLQERSFILSDFHTVHVCTQCEQLANWNANRVPTCAHCNKGKKKGGLVVKLELPYACKLLIQELMSMGISVRLQTELM